MAGNHQVFIRLDHIPRDPATGRADTLPVFPIGRFVELEPQPGASPTDRSAHRRCILADPSGEHNSVEASKGCGKRGDVTGDAVTEYFNGKAGARIVASQEIAKIRRKSRQSQHTGAAVE